MSWRTAEAVVIGSDHLRAGMPCQDRGVVRVVAKAATRLVMVACDGAGSASHAEVGATVASEVAADFLSGVAAVTRETDAGEVGARLLASVRAAVEARAAEVGVPVKMLATTLLAVVVDDEGALAFQVGDGAIVVTAGQEVQPRLVFWPFKGAHANETWFVTSDDAGARLRAALVEGRVREVAVLTDGLEHLALDFAAKAPFPGFFAPFFAAVGELAPEDEAGRTALEAELRDFLGSPRVLGETGDDKTLLLASRADAESSMGV